jgi:hypothetical protein
MVVSIISLSPGGNRISVNLTANIGPTRELQLENEKQKSAPRRRRQRAWASFGGFHAAKEMF